MGKKITVRELKDAMKRCGISGAERVKKSNKAYYERKLKRHHCAVRHKVSRNRVIVEMTILALVVGLLLFGFEYFSSIKMWWALFLVAIGVGTIIPIVDDIYLRRREQIKK